MAKHRHIVGVGLFAKKKDSGIPKHPPAQSGTAIPTDKKSSQLGAKVFKDSKHNQRKQRAK